MMMMVMMMMVMMMIITVTFRNLTLNAVYNMILFALRIMGQMIQGSLKKTKLLFDHQRHNVPYYEVPFRCYPIDMDTNMHINNACYFRVAELSRWRIFPESKMYALSVEKGNTHSHDAQYHTYVHR